MKTANLEKVVVLGSTFGALYFSYLPLVYITNAVNVGKILPFTVLIAAVGFLILMRLAFRGIADVFDHHARVVMLMYVVFALYATARYVVAVPYPDAHLTLLNVIGVNALFVFLAMFCRVHKSVVVGLILGMSGVYVVLLVDSLFGIANSDAGVVGDMFEGIGIEGVVYQNINIYLGLFAISSLYFFGNGSFRNGFVLAGIALSLYGMLQVGGRASFAAVMVVLALHLVHVVRAGFRIRGFIVVAIVFPVLIFAVASMGLGGLAESSPTINRFAGLLEGGDASLRLYLFGRAFDLFLGDVSTLVFGAGINSFPAFIGDMETSMYPHNIVLELLAEYGVVGCVLFFLPIGYSLRVRNVTLKQFSRSGRQDWIIFLIAVYFFLIACVSGGISTSWVLLFFSLLILPHREVADERTQIGPAISFQTTSTRRSN